MRIITWNINGIRAALKKGLLQFIKEQSPDILCLQEMKARIGQIPPDFLASLKDLGYFFYLNPSSIKLGHSGTAILSKIKPNQIKTEVGLERFDKEGRVLKFGFKDFSLFNFYMVNGGKSEHDMTFKLKAYDFLFDFFKKELEQNKKIILLGDFNVAHQEIDLAQPEKNKKNTGFTLEERKKIDELLRIGLVDTFRVFNKQGGNYTWWSNFANSRERNLGWRIDYCFVSNNLKKNLKKAFIMPETMGSDHCPAGINLQTS